MVGTKTGNVISFLYQKQATAKRILLTSWASLISECYLSLTSWDKKLHYFEGKKGLFLTLSQGGLSTGQHCRKAFSQGSQRRRPPLSQFSYGTCPSQVCITSEHSGWELELHIFKYHIFRSVWSNHFISIVMWKCMSKFMYTIEGLVTTSTKILLISIQYFFTLLVG